MESWRSKTAKCYKGLESEELGRIVVTCEDGMADLRSGKAPRNVGLLINLCQIREVAKNEIKTRGIAA